jgi:hypothetical protein
MLWTSASGVSITNTDAWTDDLTLSNRPRSRFPRTDLGSSKEEDDDNKITFGSSLPR